MFKSIHTPFNFHKTKSRWIMTPLLKITVHVNGNSQIFRTTQVKRAILYVSVCCICEVILFSLFKAPSFYWEAELCSLGDPGDQDPGPCISLGFAPWKDPLATGWINPVGSCLLHRFLISCFFCFVVFNYSYSSRSIKHCPGRLARACSIGGMPKRLIIFVLY